jgi:hypothetical protein
LHFSKPFILQYVDSFSRNNLRNWLFCRSAATRKSPVFVPPAYVAQRISGNRAACTKVIQPLLNLSEQQVVGSDATKHRVLSVGVHDSSKRVVVGSISR